MQFASKYLVLKNYEIHIFWTFLVLNVLERIIVFYYCNELRCLYYPPLVASPSFFPSLLHSEEKTNLSVFFFLIKKANLSPSLHFFNTSSNSISRKLKHYLKSVSPFFPCFKSNSFCLLHTLSISLFSLCINMPKMDVTVGFVTLQLRGKAEDLGETEIYSAGDLGIRRHCRWRAPVGQKPRRRVRCHPVLCPGR